MTQIVNKSGKVW